ncbi:hypothetical protein NE237_001489 [Protea cynaroides]|uniref:Uncharacterized protein n=1 Tax=Protea cynaroides TaxID=273540 RepID=A0A9Q0KT72_9MAGN|nr:hypothetical protein NE237_001489 [Protea cynaroides]
MPADVSPLGPLFVSPGRPAPSRVLSELPPFSTDDRANHPPCNLSVGVNNLDPLADPPSPSDAWYSHASNLLDELESFQGNGSERCWRTLLCNVHLSPMKCVCWNIWVCMTLRRKELSLGSLGITRRPSVSLWNQNSSQTLLRTSVESS